MYIQFLNLLVFLRSSAERINNFSMIEVLFNLILEFFLHF